jgi:hypothetical protein
MLTYHACSKCDAPVRRSRRKNLLEFLIGPVMLPYRCTVCDRREMKLRFIDMDPGASPEDVDLIITEPTERELEEQKKAEAKAAEKLAKKAGKQKKKGAKKARGEPAGPEEEAVSAEVIPEISPLSNTSDEEEERISPN